MAAQIATSEPGVFSQGFDDRAADAIVGEVGVVGNEVSFHVGDETSVLFDRRELDVVPAKGRPDWYRFTDARLALRWTDFKPDHPEGFEHLLEVAGFSGPTSLAAEPAPSRLGAMSVTAGPEFNSAGTTLRRKRPKWRWPVIWPVIAIVVSVIAIVISVLEIGALIALALFAGEGDTFTSNDRQVAVINPDVNDEALAAANRSNTLWEEGRLEEAVAEATAAIELQPDDPDILALAYVNRATALDGLGRYEEAVADATAAIELQPDNPDILALAYLNRATALDGLGRYEEAFADATAAIELQPDNPDVLAVAYLNRSARLGDLGREEEVVADLTAAIELQPDNPDILALAYVNRATALDDLGRDEDAAADLRSALGLLPPGHELYPIVTARLAELGLSE